MYVDNNKRFCRYWNSIAVINDDFMQLNLRDVHIFLYPVWMYCRLGDCPRLHEYLDKLVIKLAHSVVYAKHNNILNLYLLNYSIICC